MRRFGDGARFLEKISTIRRRFPDASLRSSFIVGYPGETEEDHDALLAFLEEAQLDWAGFFAFSNEEGTYAAKLAGHVAPTLVAERLRECSEAQDAITAAKRNALVGSRCLALVDEPGQARSHREAPEIDGIITVPAHLPVGSWAQLEITGAMARTWSPCPWPAASGARDGMTDNAVVAAPWRLKTAANGVTVARLAATPVLVVIILRATPSWGAVCFWTVLAFSDFADGWLARRRGRAPRGPSWTPWRTSSWCWAPWPPWCHWARSPSCPWPCWPGGRS